MQANAFLVTGRLFLMVCLSNLACAAGAPSSDRPVNGAGGMGATGGAATAGGGGGSSPGTGGSGGGPTATGGTSSPSDAGQSVDETLCGDVTLGAAKTVAAGKTLTICAGSTVTFSAANVSLTVQGQLLVEGTAAKPVKLGSAQKGSMDWGGLVLEAGGKLTANYLEVRNAAVALTAKPGSAFAVDHLVIESSDAMLFLSANGSIAHAALHGLGLNQNSTPIDITDASPQFTNVLVDRGLYDGVDMIVVDGDVSAPVFDHIEVADTHCAFHLNGGHGVTISNAYVHHNSYGLMVNGSVAGHVVHNNFEDNMVNVGSCSGGSVEVKDNYFAGAAFDDTCAQLAVTGVAPPMAYATGVGPTK